MDIDLIAKVCHEANRAFCESNVDFSQKSWDEASDWQRLSAINGVQYRIDNPHSTASASHDNWVDVKIKDGWVYGEDKDVEKKTHPCIVPYDQLPKFQQQKDHLFQAIVDALKD